MQLCLLPVQLFSLRSKLGTALNLAARLLLNVVLKKQAVPAGPCSVGALQPAVCASLHDPTLHTGVTFPGIVAACSPCLQGSAADYAGAAQSAGRLQQR